MPRPAPVSRPRHSALVASAVALALLAILVGGTTVPRAVNADTAGSMEASILAWINDARASRGRPALVRTAGLADLAGDRATAMAAQQRMDHDVAGCLRCQLESREIRWELHGEVIGMTSWAWGSEAARSLYDAWRGSAYHWDLLLGRDFNVVGVGVARAADGTTYGSIVLVDAPGGAPKPAPQPTPRPAAPNPKPTPVPTPTPAPPRVLSGPTSPFAHLPL